VLLLASTQAHADLVTNGSFEISKFNSDDTVPGPDLMLISPRMTNITGWTGSGSAGVQWIRLALG